MNQVDKLFQWITGQISINSEKYTPYAKSGLNWVEYQNVASTNPIIKKCIKLRQSNIGANGWNVEVKMFRSQSRNEAIEWQVYQLLESIRIEELFRNYSSHLGIYGNSILTFNSENKPILHSPALYNVYYSTLESKARKYALVIDGQEQKGELGNLQEGVDLFHLKNPDSAHKPIADSPIDSCYDWILFYQHAVQANNQLASRGWVNVLALLPENDKDTQAYLQKKDEKGKTMAQVLGERLQNWFGGTKNSSKIGILDRIRDGKEFGRTNREMQFVETQDIIAQQIGHAYGFTLADLGKDVTYNNASTFNYAQYDLVGRAEERQFEQAVNTFILPRLLKSSESMTLLSALESGGLYFKFEEPKDPDEQSNIQLQLNVLEKMMYFSDNPEYKAKLINEFRDKMNLDPIDQALLEVKEPELTTTPNQVIEVQPTKPENFATIKTPIQLALESREFERTDKSGVRKGYLPHWEKKITDQITTYADKILKKKSVDEILADFDSDFPKITEFYKKKDIKKDLLVFAEMGKKEAIANLNKAKKANKTTNVETFNQSVDEAVLKAVTDRVGYLLGDDPNYAGIDLFTAETIKKIITDNLSLSVEDLATLIIGTIPSIAQKRAELIAENNVAYIFEEAKFQTAVSMGAKWKKWVSVQDAKVRDAHRENEKIGIIPINKPFPNGNMKAGEDINCRCSTIELVEKSDFDRLL